MFETRIKVDDIIKFRNDKIPGMIVKLPTGEEGTIKEIYPFITMTDKGCFKWKDIYLAERGCYDKTAVVRKGIKE